MEHDTLFYNCVVFTAKWVFKINLIDLTTKWQAGVVGIVK